MAGKDGSLLRWRVVAVTVVALMVGLALGPAAGSAASIAWVRIKNWPTSTKVKVLNWPDRQAVTVANTPTVDVRNWPTTQNVAVTNLPATQTVSFTNGVTSPIYVREIAPERTPVNMTLGASMSTTQTSATGTNYTVPAGKYLVITSASVWGIGTGPISAVSLAWNANLAYIPFHMQADNAVTIAVGSLDGEIRLDPGTKLTMHTSRQASGSIFNTVVTLCGYLTDTP